MKKILALAMSLVLTLGVMADDLSAFKGLVGRLLPELSSQIEGKKLPAKKTGDYFQLSTENGKLIVGGNNANSMAVGLNYYLKYYCNTVVSWFVDEKFDAPKAIVPISEPVTIRARVKERFFLNYCTFGYTMPWWKWKQWERFIDWMALNGVNMPLAITGQEAVWQKVWRKYGLSDEQIRSYFTGPAHLPWQRMCNIDRWQGPLPQSWIDGQAKLQKRILRRERSLNMTPVLPAFSGHVPAELKDVLSDNIDCHPVRRWAGFDEQYRCTFLSPTDPIFASIQKDFLEEQTRMYGTDHIYGVDCFNEVPPPSWDPGYLAKVSAGVYDSMASVDPDAVWLQMGWLFISSRRNWTPERIKAYLTAVPQGRMILLDYESDYLEIWRHTESFYGQPFIWCYLGNFGGMTEIEGDYYHNARLIAATKEEGGPGFVGLGCTLEGFGVNEAVYEAVLSQAWSNAMPTDKYIDNIADRHLGRADSLYRKYWHMLADNVCITHTSTSASGLICARPSLEGVRHSTTLYDRGYDIEYLDEALEVLDKVQGTSDYFRFDYANAHRQAITNKAPAIREKFASAFKAGDRAGMVAARDEFLALCDDLTAVASTRPEFSLDDWIRDARSWGRTSEEKDYFEMNARTIISVWGDSFRLCDYANRDWDGLIETYYKPRWQMFFDAVIAAFDAGEEYVDQKSPRALQFDKDCWEFECRWAKINN
ncbi:MAG: alpha-N-acetylglucosaminidase [Bacteroidales bacterium]|nr:alpha-N-acetylglucosaminidase [Bacteroidales bacterium]